MGATILDPNIEDVFGDVTSDPNTDIRLKLYFKRDICEFIPLHFTYIIPTFIVYPLDARFRSNLPYLQKLIKAANRLL
jgi:hypothetical protein